MTSNGYLEAFLIALGGGVGALLRFEIGYRLRSLLFSPVLATLGVNLSGCFLAGVLTGFASASGWQLATFLLVGLLGSYTTVSALALETVNLWQAHRWLGSSAYLLATLAGGLAVTLAGLHLGVQVAGT